MKKVAVLGLAAYGAKELYDQWTEKDLTGEVVVITGAASGLGRLMALALAKSGCRVALLDLHQEPLDAVVKDIKAFGGEAVAYVADVTDRERIYALAHTIQDLFGQVDMLINNAGIVTGKKFQDCSDAMMEKTVQVNTIAHFWTIKAFLPGMLQRNHGHIVTVASYAGITGTAGLVDYCASKFGAVGLAEALRMEIKEQGKNGVSTTCVCPMFIKTGMFEGTTPSWATPWLEPEYVVDKIVQAIRRKQEVLFMPRLGYPCYVLKAVLPTRLSDSIATALGANKCMSTFVQTRKN